MEKIAVIGGGAAGMMAAISAAETSHEVHLFEKNEKLGKKIFITGKGRCNLTNASDMDEIRRNIVTNSKFMYSALYTLSNDDVIQMFQDVGVETKVERGNRVFPVSDKSSDIIWGLTKMLKKQQVMIHLNTGIQDILWEEGLEKKPVIKGIITEDGEKLFFSKVIIATGGYSYQSTGSTGDGYRFAKETGHRVTDILPALVPLVVKEECVKEMQGLSLKNIRADFYVEGKKVYSDFGEMLFTHFGVSGPPFPSNAGANKPKENAITANTAITIHIQNCDLAKFFKFLFAVPPNENINTIIRPTIGIMNNNSYPKYPHIPIGRYSSGT